jgi:cation-dependent mannose-6-phosphate receptor
MQQNDLVFRGRKLVLNYTDGSPCGGSSSHSSSVSAFDEEYKDVESLTSGGFRTYSSSDDDEDKDKDKDKDKEKEKEKEKHGRKKSTIISLLCEADPLAAKAAISFVAASDDECTYFFEARTHAACGTIEKEAQQLGPSGVFGVM